MSSLVMGIILILRLIFARGQSPIFVWQLRVSKEITLGGSEIAGVQYRVRNVRLCSNHVLPQLIADYVWLENGEHDYMMSLNIWISQLRTLFYFRWRFVCIRTRCATSRRSRNKLHIQRAPFTSNRGTTRASSDTKLSWQYSLLFGTISNAGTGRWNWLREKYASATGGCPLSIIFLNVAHRMPLILFVVRVQCINLIRVSRGLANDPQAQTMTADTRQSHSDQVLCILFIYFNRVLFSCC